MPVRGALAVSLTGQTASTQTPAPGGSGKLGEKAMAGRDCNGDGIDGLDRRPACEMGGIVV